MTDTQRGNPAWFIDERAYAGPEHLDPEFVRDFDRKQRFDPRPDVEKLRALGLDHSSTLIDFGAGTGAMALAAASFCRRVVAIDVSPLMLDVLREKAAAAGVRNVEVLCQGMLTYEHRGGPADFAVSRNALHSLPDFWKVLALQRIAAALKPGGVFLLRDLVYSFEPQESEQVLEAWFAAAPAQRPEDGYTREEYETHVRTEFSAFSWLLEPMLMHTGFDVTERWYDRSRVFAAYTCVRR